jgi:hypothetical protein
MNAPVSQTRHLIGRTIRAYRLKAGDTRDQKTAQTLRLTTDALDKVGQPLAPPTQAAVPLGLPGEASSGSSAYPAMAGRRLFAWADVETATTQAGRTRATRSQFLSGLHWQEIAGHLAAASTEMRRVP